MEFQAPPDVARYVWSLNVSKPVVAAVRINPPYVYPCVINSPHNCAKPGINFELFQTLMTFVGLKYTTILAANNATGWQDPEGEWHGLLGQIVRAEADMGLSPIAVREDRFKDVGFTTSVEYAIAGFLIKRPEVPHTSALPIFLFKAIPINVLCCVLFLYAQVVLFGIVFLSYNRLWNDVTKSASYSDLLNIATDAARPVFNQTITAFWTFPDTYKLLLMGWRVGMSLLLCVYSGEIASKLVANPTPKQPFTGLDDFSHLVYNNKFRLLVVGDSSFFRPSPFYNQSSSSQVPKDATQRLELAFHWNPTLTVDTMQNAVRLVAQNSSLALYGTLYRLNEAAASNCMVTVIEDKYSIPPFLAIPVSKNTELQKLLSVAISGAQNSSVTNYINYLYKKYNTPNLCPTNDHREPLTKKNFGLDHVEGAFNILLLGLLICGLCFVCEKSWKTVHYCSCTHT